MSDRDKKRNISIDVRTGSEITRSIGDELRRSLGPSHHSDRLQSLLDAFTAQDEQNALGHRTE